VCILFLYTNFKCYIRPVPTLLHLFFVIIADHSNSYALLCTKVTKIIVYSLRFQFSQNLSTDNGLGLLIKHVCTWLKHMYTVYHRE
jgi:hypothetical protein